MSLHTVVMDFEAAVWGAFRSVFPATTLRGCSFHWGQAVWRRIQDDGLGPTYRRKKNMKFLRKFLSSKLTKEYWTKPTLVLEQIANHHRPADIDT